MESYDPISVAEDAKQEQEQVSELAQEALQWFISEDKIGSVYERADVVSELAEKLDITQTKANDTISSLVGDIVDPVQQMVKESTAYVGVIEYNVYSDEGAYGYIHFDDRVGAKKRVVCARCVEKHQYDENISHATQGEGTNSDDSGWDSLLNKVTAHYSESHTKGPQQVEPGASLISNTTISGNTVVHTGNQSLVDHDLIGGVSSGDHHSRYSDGEAQNAVSEARLDQSHGLAVSDLTASGDDLSTDWNNNGFRLTASNNAVSIFIPDITNNRDVVIQGGHRSGGFSDFLSDMFLNPLGGRVIVRDGDVVVGDSKYEIQKDGNDGTGVINFKT